MSTHDAIVIGLGGMGSAALAHLSGRGLDVLGLEQFQTGHDRGSSHGETRIIRRAYFEHPDYVPLVERSYALWDDLESATETKLVNRTGLALFGGPSGEVVPGVRRAAAAHGLDIWDVDRADVLSRFPGFAPSADMDVLYEPDAGILAVEACVQAHLQQAVRCSAHIVEREAVVSWRSTGIEVEVRTEGACHKASHLVICAGAWTSTLLRDWCVSMQVRRQVVSWFGTRGRRYRVEEGCPVFCFDTDDGFFYGFPVLDERGIKIARHDRGEIVEDPGAIDRSKQSIDRASVERFIDRYLPDVVPTAMHHSVCMYTMTPDSHFIIDRHRDYPNVVIAAGFSGHGFKFAPVVGSILADLVTTGKTAEPIDFLRASRPAIVAG